MIDQNIGNPEITRKHLSQMQTFYEAQLVAKRHYDALMTSLNPLQDAADVLRASGVVNVDALLSQPVSATKAMIDEMEAEAALPDGFERHASGRNPMPYDEDCTENVAVMFRDGGIDDAHPPAHWNKGPYTYAWGWVGHDESNIVAHKPPEGFSRHSDGKWRASDADELNDLSPHEGEEEDGLPHWAKLYSDDGDWTQYDYSGNVPDNVVSVLYADGEVDDASGAAWLLYEEVVSGNFPKEDVIIGYKLETTEEKHLDAQTVEQEQPAPAPETVDHAAEAAAQIEAQAETESTEPEADHFVLDADGRELRVGDSVIACSSVRGLSGAFEIEEIAGDVVIGEAVMFTSRLVQLVEKSEPDTAETMQAIGEAVEAVDAEPETPVAPEDTVTEQPETPEPETPSQPEEPKAERKSFDFSNDFTQEEVLAQSGNANFSPRENQADDIAAAEREEFDALYNPWNTAAKAEG